jgi:hypothetical protein
MAGFKLSGFAGMAPRVSPSLLGDNEAQMAENAKLYSGELRSWRKPGSLTPKQDYDFAPLSIYRTIGADGSPLFLAWDKDVDVVKSGLDNADEKPMYYTGDGYPKKTNLTLALQGTAADGVVPREYLALGVPTPVSACSVEIRVPVDSDPEFPTTITDYVGISENFVLNLVGGAVQIQGVVTPASKVIETYPNQAVVVGMSVSGACFQPGTKIIDIYEHPDDNTRSIIRIDKNVLAGFEGEQTIDLLNTVADRTSSQQRTAADGYARTNALPAETRGYIYTYVSEFGSIEEESAPSPVSDLITVRFGQLCHLKNFTPPPAGKYNIKYIRIYRSVTGSLGTPYLFVGQIDANETEFEDAVLAADLGEVCPSLNWGPPPEDLQGLVGLANGSLAGFSGNELWFSEPYAYHAFPFAYMLTTEFKIVGLGVFGESLAVMTEGNPYIVTGTDPSAMSMSKLPMFEPCISKRSVASDENGVMYASPNGLILIGPGGAQNSTRNMFTRDEWQKYNPSSLLARMVDGKYIGFWEVPTDGVNPGDLGGLILDRYTQSSPLSVTSYHATAAYMEPTEAVLYMAVDREIMKWEGDPYNTLPYEWVSKLFVTPRPLNLGAVQVDADFGDIDSATLLQAKIEQLILENQTIWNDGDLLGAMGSRALNQVACNGSRLFEVSVAVDDRYILLTVIADGRERARVSIKNRNAVRLPSGYKADRWEFKLNGNIPLKHVKVAETAKGLIEL